MKAKIHATGIAFPERVLTNQDLEKLVDTSDEWIRERTGIVTRRIVSEGECTSDIAIAAALRALENADLAPEKLNVIIVCTNSPDQLLPATACFVQKGIGATNTVAFDINAACAGWVVGLSMARDLVRSGSHEHVMVIGAESLTRLTNWKDRDTCVLFGDGAGATLVSRAAKGDKSEIFPCSMRTDGNFTKLLEIPAGAAKLPSTPELLAEGKQYIAMKGKEIFKHAVRAMSDRCHEVLKLNNYTLDDVKWLIPHQANIRIIDKVAKVLGVPPEKAIVNVDKYGNMSTATIPVALHENVESGKIKSGDLVLMTSFGGGLTSAAALIRV